MTTLTELNPAAISGTWKLDPAHSEVSFTVKHLAITKVRGTFETFDVTIVTGESLADSKIEASVDVSSVNTGQPGRDDHLRSGDFFLIEEHPHMLFSSTTINSDGGDDFTIHGDLTLRGVTLPVVLKGEFGGITTDMQGNTKAGASATTKINRKDFGVNWNATLETGGFMLGDDVTITIDLQVVLEK